MTRTAASRLARFAASAHAAAWDCPAGRFRGLPAERGSGGIGLTAREADAWPPPASGADRRHVADDLSDAVGLPAPPRDVYEKPARRFAAGARAGLRRAPGAALALRDQSEGTT